MMYIANTKLRTLLSVLLPALLIPIFWELCNRLLL